MREFVAFALMSIAASIAQAQTKELYVGFAGVRSELDNFFQDAANRGDIVDSTDDSFKLFAGYKLTQKVSAELSYIDKLSFKRTLNPSVANDVTNLDVSAFAFNVVAAFPFGERFEAFGKAGFGLWKFEGTNVTTTSGSPQTVATTYDYRSGNGVAYGLGGNYKFNENFKLRAEYDVIEVLADLELQTFSLGVIWEF